MDKFTKQSSERLDYDVDLADSLVEDGDVVVSATVTADDAGITLEDMTINQQANIVKQWVSGGVHGQAYKLTCIAETEHGRRIETDFTIKIKDI